MLEMTPMASLRLPAEPLRVLDLPNIEHELVERRAATASGLRRLALSWEALKVRREEKAATAKFDLLLTTSDREQGIVSGWKHQARVETVPNAIDAEHFAFSPRPEPAAHHLVFIGTTHVDANRDGLRYFMNEIHPLLVDELPDVAVSIVGGAPPAEIRAYAERPNVTVTGYVKDVRDYMARADALIVPLRSGGGTRLKILEGLSFGVPTISTTVGAEGLDLEPGRHIMIGDTAADFARAALAVLTDGSLRRHLSEQGRQFVAERYDWPVVGSRLRDILATSAAAKRAGAQRQAERA
jgi:glycosyltransferase involved in cell wall biosynthesis